MTAEQFCLRWNNHQRTLVSVFDGLFESGTLVDCTLAADGQYLKAHKVVLCACSPYLEALLSQHYNQHPIVILKDVKFEELQAIMEYMYRGEVNVTQEQLGLFLKAAEMLQVKGLTYSDNKPGGASAQIVSSTFSVGIDGGKDASVVKPQDSKKKEKLVISPATGSQNSLVDTLKLLPSKLVIDIPPISPANSAKDGSVSPNPQKRKKLSPPQSEVKSVRSRFSPSNNSECATNNTSTAAAGHSKFVFDVDPTDIVNSQNIKIEESSEDSYDSDTLVVDEESGADKNHQEPGPSHASSAVADGCTWNAQGDDHPEATKGFNAMECVIDVLETDKGKLFICSCSKVYKTEQFLKHHKMFECGKDRFYKCPHCTSKFTRKYTLKTHVVMKHKTRSSDFNLNADACAE